MDVFLMIRRKTTSVFTDCKETTPIAEVKKIVQGIMKIAPESQRLYKDEQIMEDGKCLSDYGLTSSTARAQTPATVGLAYRQDDGSWEQLEIAPLSNPPELPDVMKPQEPQQEQSN